MWILIIMIAIKKSTANNSSPIRNNWRQSNWNSFKIMGKMPFFSSVQYEQTTDCPQLVSHLCFGVSGATDNYTPHYKTKNMPVSSENVGAPIVRQRLCCWFSVKCAPTVRVWQTADAICSIIKQIVALKLLLNDSVTPKLMKSQWYAHTVYMYPVPTCSEVCPYSVTHVMCM